MRLEMLQVARLAPNLLHDARDLVADFVRSQFTGDGGFADRAGKGDLYYTVFGLECLLALREDLPRDRVAGFLQPFGDGEGLDLVHLSCLARCWAALEMAGPASHAVGPAVPANESPQTSAPSTPAANGAPADFRRPAQPALPAPHRAGLAARLAGYRSRDGAYSQQTNDDYGNVYATFVAMGALQDLKLDPPDPAAIIANIRTQRCDDGCYAGSPDLPVGTTPTTAAAVTMLRVLGEPADRAAADWLLARAHPAGGFLAIPQAPVPDLLSTAVALHALSGMHVSINHLKEPCLDFLDSLWVNRGSFFGHWHEEHLDVEYTWYALLALGHLSLL